MQGRISPDIAQAAVNLSLSHPKAPALDVLDLALQDRQGCLDDFGTISPTSAFGQLIAAAFDRGMTPEDWRLINSSNSPPAVVAVLQEIWGDQVLPAFAARYSLIASVGVLRHSAWRPTASLAAFTDGRPLGLQPANL